MAVLEFAKDWISGTEIEDAIRATKEAESLGMKTTVTYLPEFLKTQEQVGEVVDTYLKLIDRIREEKLMSAISLKATQLGALINKETFLKNYEKILEEAHRSGVFVWLDMENFENIKGNIAAYVMMHKIYANMGLTLQAKVKRTFFDLKELIRNGAIIKLEKGYYPSVEGKTYDLRTDIDKKYVEYMKYLFANSERFALGVDDPKIIDTALKLEKKYKKQAKFVLFMGMVPKLAKKLAKAKRDVNIYTPFGKEWLGYMMRRFREEGTIKYFTKALAEEKGVSADA